MPQVALVGGQDTVDWIGCRERKGHLTLLHDEWLSTRDLVLPRHWTQYDDYLQILTAKQLLILHIYTLPTSYQTL